MTEFAHGCSSLPGHLQSLGSVVKKVGRGGRKKIFLIHVLKEKLMNFKYRYFVLFTHRSEFESFDEGFDEKTGQNVRYLESVIIRLTRLPGSVMKGGASVEVDVV